MIIIIIVVTTMMITFQLPPTHTHGAIPVMIGIIP